ncbi:type II toxin-antitoxin system RelE family toxin [Corynebacterium stationis]|uniref:type II toxin-antitoxin system RelE family toxin n=1 Tax=Corynebacterium stationis TaxID=1705 RepID=UPI00350EDA91
MQGGSGEYRIRVGSYRVVYEIQDKQLIILVLNVGSTFVYQPDACRIQQKLSGDPRLNPAQLCSGRALPQRGQLPSVSRWSRSSTCRQ